MTVTDQATSPTPAGGTSREPTGASDGRPVTAGGGIERVNAFDGLFLRAEHLDRMQDYARELAAAVGTAGGPGVVEGYGVTVRANKLEVAPGLAVDAYGRPLRSRGLLTLDLTNLAPGDTEFHFVEIRHHEWFFGNEAVQGVLCEDPCSGGGTARPYQAEGVLLGLDPAAESGLASVPDDRRRSWLASKLFADERTDADAWPEVGQPHLHRQSWAPPNAPQTRPGGVRLAVLRSDGDDGWSVDVWAARRDRGDPPPTRTWQSRLGMRPWDVYVAQILQFQAHLQDVGGDSSGLQRASFVGYLLGDLMAIRDQVMKTNRSVTLAGVQRLEDGIRAGRLGDAVAVEHTFAPLPSLGFGELPPAGFLPIGGAESRRAVAAQVTELLGGEGMVDVRACTGSLGDVGAMIHRAQHRDRIRLTEGGRVPIDVLAVEGSGKAGFDWVVFARRETIDCARDPEKAATEQVAVYVVDGDKDPTTYDAYLEYIEARRAGKEAEQPDLPDGDPRLLTYPVRTWALPEDEGYADLVAELRALVADRRVHVVSVATDDPRRTLLTGRAGILAALCTESDIDGPRLVSFVGETEAVVVLHRTRDDGRQPVPRVRNNR